MFENNEIKEGKQHYGSVSQKVIIVSNDRNGRAMVIGGHYPVLVVFCLDVWRVKKLIELPEDVSGVRHIEFLPQLFDAGANKVSEYENLFCNWTCYVVFCLVDG
jgi:hypothetical protein